MAGTRILSIQDVTVDSLYSAMVIDADKSVLPEIRLFEYAQSQQVVGTQLTATAAHTNVPRGGYVGLPIGWEMYVSRWQAKTNLRIDEPIMDWAAETSVRLVYNDRRVQTVPLLDLLMAPRHFYSLDPSTSDANGARLWMRENISYHVDISMQPRAITQLQEFLMEHTRGHRMILWIYFDGVLRRAVQ